MIWRASAAARRITYIVTIAGLALLLAPTARLPAQTGGTPLIRIPPARLPPLAESTPVATATTPGIAPAPRALLPTTVQVLHDSRGAGIAMYGALTGKASSAAGVVLAVFANSGAFDPTPSVQLMLADDADQHAQALFTATEHRTPIIGVTVVALSNAGGDVTVFYDGAAAFAASLPRMRQALAQSDGVGTVVLSPIHLGDGSQVSLPPGWRVTSQGVGSVDLQGPQGEFLSFGATMPVYIGTSGSGDFGFRAHAAIHSRLMKRCCRNSRRSRRVQVFRRSSRARSSKRDMSQRWTAARPRSFCASCGREDRIASISHRWASSQD